MSFAHKCLIGRCNGRVTLYLNKRHNFFKPILFCNKTDFRSANLTSEVTFFNEILRAASSTNACELRTSPFMRPFWSFLELSRAGNFSRSKVHSPDREVCCDWSTFFTFRFSRNARQTPKCVRVGGYLSHKLSCAFEVKRSKNFLLLAFHFDSII